MTGIEIRPARDGDAPSLAHVWNDSWHAGHAHLDPEAAAFRDLPYFQARIGSGPDLQYMIVATIEGEIAGFSRWEGDGIAQVFVAPDHFRKGIGEALLRKAETALKDAGHKTIWLHCQEGNDHARAFYEKHGWRVTRTFDTETGTHKGPMPTRAWHMEKTL